MQITGKYSQKMYRCTRCDHESLHGTNHYGDIYPSCPKCSWKNPMRPQATHICLEPLPSGWGRPARWTFVRLGDIAEIVTGVDTRCVKV